MPNIIKMLLFVQIAFTPGWGQGMISWFKQSRSVNEIPEDVLKVAQMTAPELIASNGYPAETHYVKTEDGYILALHRIRKDGGVPHLLQHGLFDSSVGYVLMGPKISLGYLLWDRGYDVWLGNARGNRYSRNHTHLDPQNREFWDFSWHEIGFYDIPTMIDYILNTTNYQKLYYTGHSQGGTAFWVMASKRPEYNDKIILMQGLAPAGYVDHLRSPLYGLVRRFGDNIINFLGRYEILPHHTLKESGLCFSNPSFRAVFKNSLWMLLGKDEQELNITMLPAICGQVPAGAATKQLMHYLQLKRSGRFCEFDYGPTMNKQRYGSATSPNYNLSKITAPVVIHHSENDLLCVPIDIEKLYRQLGNPRGLYLISMPEFNHIDFLWAINVRSLLYDRYIKIMENYLPPASKGN